MAKDDNAPDAVPRLAGRTLRAVAALLGSPLGAPLRRTLGSLVVDRKLASIDFAAEGEPPPTYLPRAFRRPGEHP